MGALSLTLKVAPAFAGGPKATRDIPLPPDFLWKLALVPTKENLMLNRTSLLLAAAVVALGAGAASAASYDQNNYYNQSAYSHYKGSNKSIYRKGYDRGFRDGYARGQRDNRFHGGGYGAPVVGVSFDFGEVAFGYQDGYWDRGRQWHNWQNEDQHRSYRSASGAKYYDWKHTRDSDNGWH